MESEYVVAYLCQTANCSTDQARWALRSASGDAEGALQLLQAPQKRCIVSFCFNAEQRAYLENVVRRMGADVVTLSPMPGSDAGPARNPLLFGVPGTASPYNVNNAATCCQSVGFPHCPCQHTQWVPHMGHCQPTYAHPSIVDTVSNLMQSICVVGAIGFSDSMTPVTDVVNATLIEVPWNSPSTSLQRCHKVHMQDALRVAGLPYATTVHLRPVDVVRGCADAQLKDFTYPVVVKPVQSGGTEGVTLCYSFDDVMRCYKSLVGGLSCERLLIESIAVQEYLVGREFVVNTLSYGKGKHIVTDVWESKKHRDIGFVYDTQTFIRNCTANADVLKIIKYTLATLDAVGLHFGCGHSEIILCDSDNTPRLVEVNARPQGDIPRAADIVGYDQFTLLAALFFDRASLPAYPELYNCDRPASVASNGSNTSTTQISKRQESSSSCVPTVLPETTTRSRSDVIAVPRGKLRASPSSLDDELSSSSCFSPQGVTPGLDSPATMPQTCSPRSSAPWSDLLELSPHTVDRCDGISDGINSDLEPCSVDWFESSLADSQVLRAGGQVPVVSDGPDADSVRVVFLVAPFPGYLDCGVLDSIRALSTFSRFTRTCWGPTGRYRVKQTVDLLTSPGAVVLRGFLATLDADEAAIRGLERSGLYVEKPIALEGLQALVGVHESPAGDFLVTTPPVCGEGHRQKRRSLNKANGCTEPTTGTNDPVQKIDPHGQHWCQDRCQKPRNPRRERKPNRGKNRSKGTVDGNKPAGSSENPKPVQMGPRTVDNLPDKYQHPLDHSSVAQVYSMPVIVPPTNGAYQYQFPGDHYASFHAAVMSQAGYYA